MSRDKRPHVSTASTGTTAEKSVDEFLEGVRTYTYTNVYVPRVTLSIRVKPEVYTAFHSLRKSLKNQLREHIEKLILAFSKGMHKVRSESGTTIVNINIVSTKAEANQHPSYDIELLREENRILKNDLRKAKQIIQHLKKEKEELKHEAHALRKQITILEKKLREIQPYAQAYLKLKQHEKIKQLLR